MLLVLLLVSALQPRTGTHAHPLHDFSPITTDGWANARLHLDEDRVQLCEYDGAERPDRFRSPW